MTSANETHLISSRGRSSIIAMYFTTDPIAQVNHSDTYFVEVEWYIYAAVNCAMRGADIGLSPIFWTNVPKYKLATKEKQSAKLEVNFRTRKLIWKWHLENGGHFLSAQSVKWQSCQGMSSDVIWNRRPLVWHLTWTIVLTFGREVI